MKITRFVLVCIAWIQVLTLGAGAGETKGGGGSIGFSLQVSADGVFSPKVSKVSVKTVVAGSQAEAAGLAVGDELIQVEGVTVPGASASVLKPHMELVARKPKKLRLKRSTGREYEVTLTRPSSQ